MFLAQHDALNSLGDKVRHVGKAEARPKWLVHFVGEERHYDVVHLSFQGVAKLVRGGRSGFNDEDMKQLAKFPKLRRLSLHSTDVTSKGMPHLSRLYELETLSLEMTYAGPGISHLSNLRNLRDLNLAYCNSKGQFEHLAKLNNLERLECGSVDELDLVHIARLPRLKELKLLAAGLTERGIRELSGHQSLEKLWLTVGNQNVEVADCPNLKFLYVSCYSGDRPNLRLRNLPKLSKLDNRHMTLVEAESVPLLQSPP